MALLPESKKIQRIGSGRGGKRPGAGRKRGRPAAPQKATTVQRNDIADAAKEYADLALRALIDVATSGESEAARVTAASALLDRGYGRPRQAIEHTGANGGPILHQVWQFGGKQVAF